MTFDDQIWQGAASSVSWDAPPPITFDGTVVAQETAIQTDFNSGEPLSWPDGRPRRKVIITLADKDGQLHGLHVRVPSGLYNAIKTAIQLQSVPGLREGDWLSITYTGDGEKEGKKSAPKLFEVVLGPGEGAPQADRTDEDGDDF